MSKLLIARKKQRAGLYLPMGGTLENPALLFFLPEKGVEKERQIDSNQLDEQIRAQLQKVGITKEADVQAVIAKAEEDYEYRVKLEETKKELRRLMALRAEGKKLMQRGWRKWKEVSYRPIQYKGG